MSEWIAALPMYDWPERRAEVDAEWAAIRDRLRAAGIDAPEALTRADDLHAQWRSPNLLIGQTCWGPMDCGIADHVQVLAHPSYDGIEGGQGEFYSSAVVVRRDAVDGDADAGILPPLTPPHKGEGDSATSAIPSPLWGGVRDGGEGTRLPLDMMRGRRFVYNNPDSMSGLLGLKRDLEAIGESLDLFSVCLESGGHRNSVKLIAAGAADIGVIDCRSWQLAKRHEPEAAGALKVVGWTSLRKGLPFVTARGTPAEVVTALKAALAGAALGA